jgi:two-component system sensor histidine kinase/response regulator
VLLVEDNEMNQEVAIAMLMGIGASVDLAVNGREAVEIVDQANGEYHAVLMDVQMPEMDGVEATRKLREHYSPVQLPIIAMTAHAFQEERDRCFAAGMNDYLTKPVTAERLTAALSRWARDRKAAGTPAPQAEPAPADAAGWSMAGIDAATAMKDFGFSEELFIDLLGKFHRQYESLPTQLDAALAASDSDRLMKLAHTLRGSAGYVGATEARGHAGALEDAIRKGGVGGAEMTAMVAALRASIITVLESTARFAAPAQRA